MLSANSSTGYTSATSVRSSVFFGSRYSIAPSFAYMKSRKFLYMAVCTGNLLVLSFGMAYAWSSPVLLRLTNKEYLHYNPLGRVITTEEASWIGSCIALGGMLGTFIAGFIASKLGRKPSLVLSCALPFIISYLIIAFAKTVYLFFLARIICGIAISGIYTVVPMYLGEIAEDEIRGFISCSIMTFETFGELITYSVCPHLSMRSFSFLFIGITLIVATVVIMVLPESPYFLISVNKIKKAEQALMKLRSTTAERVKLELNFMESIVEESGGQVGKITDLMKTKASRRAEATTIILTILQHFSGIVPIAFYSQTIFKESGTSLEPDHCTLIIAIVQCFSSFIAPNLADRLGRRWTLFISACGMMISELLLGAYLILRDKHYNVSYFYWAPVLCMVLYLVFYISGFGPLIWTIMGELFPPHLKAPAFTVGVWFWWLMAFTVSKMFHWLVAVIGMGQTFLMFGFVCLLAMFFVLTYVIETRGKSFQEIQDMLSE